MRVLLIRFMPKEQVLVSTEAGLIHPREDSLSVGFFFPSGLPDLKFSQHPTSPGWPQWLISAESEI